MPAELSTGERRTAFIAKARSAIRAGQSQTAFIRRMRAEGLGYRHQTMQSDFRTEGNIRKKTDLLKYVRKDYYPTKAIYAESTYALKKEFMYVVRVKSRLSPDEPILTHNVGIATDKPLTVGEMIRQTHIMAEQWTESIMADIIEVTPLTAVQRVLE